MEKTYISDAEETRMARGSLFRGFLVSTLICGAIAYPVMSYTQKLERVEQSKIEEKIIFENIRKNKGIPTESILKFFQNVYWIKIDRMTGTNKEMILVIREK